MTTEYRKMKLYLQQIISQINENQLSKQSRDLLHSLQYLDMGYETQKDSIVYLFLGAFLGLGLSSKNYILILIIAILSTSLIIHQNLKYRKQKRSFLSLYKQVKEIEKVSSRATDNISNKIISGVSSS